MPRPRVLFGMLVVVLVGSFLFAQEKKDPPTVRARGQLRAGWKQLGLTDEQVQRVYTVQSEYRTKIDALEAQIKELKQKQEQEEFKVLTDAQKARLREILSSKVPQDKKPEEKKPENAKPVEKKP